MGPRQARSCHNRPLPRFLRDSQAIRGLIGLKSGKFLQALMSDRGSQRWRGVQAAIVATLGVGLVLTMTAMAADNPVRQVTFSKDVAPIFQAKCQECHQPNSIAPMSLITFQEARPWARSIKERGAARQMPPWHIDRGLGLHEFKNDMSLTVEQVNTIVRWVDGGALQ